MPFRVSFGGVLMCVGSWWWEWDW